MADRSLRRDSFQSSSLYSPHPQPRSSASAASNAIAEAIEDNDDNGDGDDEIHPQSQPLESSSYQVRKRVTPRDQLVAFLELPLRPFVASKRATGSKATRGPQYFDLHLHPDLQLRKIVIVDDLHTKIASICDDFLSKHLLHLRASTDFPFAEKEQKPDPADDDAAVSESTLANSYVTKFGRPLATVTSTLVFERPIWKTVFDYTLIAKETVGLNYAKPDGFFCVAQSTDIDADDNIKSLPTNQQMDIKTIIKHNLHHLALWEFKNLAAGSKEAMDNFLKLEGEFIWPLCNRERNLPCDDVRHDKDGVVNFTGRKIGFDAREVSVLSQIFEREELEEDVASTLAAGLQTEVPMEVYKEGPPTASTSRKLIGKTKSKTSKTAAVTAPPSLSTIPKKEIKAKESKRKRDLEDQPQKPHDMAVQIWSEGVKYDATVLILNAGNYEIICIRRRDTQTLYISRVISVEDPIYKKTQTGLQALAYYDARDRAYQLEALETAKNPIFPRYYYLNLHLNPYPPVHKAVANLSPVTINTEAVYQDLLDELRSKGKFRILLRSPSGKNNKYGLCTILRHSGASTPSGPSAVSAWSLELAKKITDRVWLVTTRNQNNSLSDKLVLKLGENSFEHEQLKYEYKTHLRFKAEFGIEVFGIIHVPDSNRRGMLMTMSGYSLEQLRKRRKMVYAEKHSQKYVDAIKTLHHYNFLHGNLKRDHFLLSDEGCVSLISYRTTYLNRSSRVEIETGKETAVARGNEDEMVDTEYAKELELEVKLASNLFNV